MPKVLLDSCGASDLICRFVLGQGLQNYSLRSGDENTDAGWLRFDLVETLMFIHMSSQSFFPHKKTEYSLMVFI